ncbi:MAG: threonine aldolase family protein [Nakamurella sp.]
MIIDLRSDTKTLPTQGMLSAIANARLGDDQEHEDFETTALQDEIKRMLGLDFAIFLPSATMANQIALMCQVSRGEEVIADEFSHIFRYEGGGAAYLAGATTRGVTTVDGVLEVDQIREIVTTQTSEHIRRTALISVENTHNTSGSTAWPMDRLDALMAYARDVGMPVHIDGSRLFNAAAFHQESPARLVQGASSVTLCFSKGLGCPAGAMLAGRSDQLHEAPVFRQMMGGSLRQSGILAAAARYALQHNVDRLADDHANAELLRNRLADAGMPVVRHPRSTNFVFLDVASLGISGEQARALLAEAGVKWSAGRSASLLRAVPHLGVTTDDIVLAAQRTIAALQADSS